MIFELFFATDFNTSPNFLASIELSPIIILEGFKLSARALPSLRNSGEYKIRFVLKTLRSLFVCPIGIVDLIMTILLPYNT